MKTNEFRTGAKSLMLIIVIMTLSGSLLFGQKEFYIPKALLIPLHSQKQQLNVSLGYGGGVDLNCSYSFTNHFAGFITGNLNLATYKRSTIGFGDEYKIVKNDYNATLGIGYFNKGEVAFIETYLGAGINRVNNHWSFIDNSDGAEYTKAHYWNVFSQVNIGRKGKEIEYGVAGRLSYSKYSNMKFYDTHPNMSDVTRRYEELKILSLEPALFFGFEIKKIVIDTQIGLVLPLNTGKFNQINSFANQSVTNEMKDVREFSLFGRVSLRYYFNFSKDDK